MTILYGKFSLSMFGEALVKTILITSMIMFILMAGSLFTGVFVASGGMSIMREIIGGLELSPFMLLLIMIQTSYLTPPMAQAIFYLRGVAPPAITLRHMCAGVIPFIVIQIIALVIVAAFPQTALWLPNQLLGFN